MKSAVRELGNIRVTGGIFMARLGGRQHSFKARSTPTHPPVAELQNLVKNIDRWYIDYADILS